MFAFVICLLLHACSMCDVSIYATKSLQSFSMCGNSNRYGDCRWTPCSVHVYKVCTIRKSTVTNDILLINRAACIFSNGGSSGQRHLRYWAE